MNALKTRPEVRDVIYRTRGHAGGPITRLVSPSDLGEVIKPFVFLDNAQFTGDQRRSMQEFWHPHSGIATVTVVLDGGIKLEDTTGARVTIPAGGIEWMRAGGGVWHTGQALPGTVKVFQLWVALPPALESAPSESRYLMPDEVPVAGPARVILGEYGGQRSPIDAPPLTYLQVDLADGEHWTFEPGAGETVAWVAVMDGTLHASSRISAGEIAVFRSSTAAIDLVAETRTRFVIGSAVPHAHDLHLGNYSVHTTAEALEHGEAEIRRIGRELRANGTLGRR